MWHILSATFLLVLVAAFPYGAAQSTATTQQFVTSNITFVDNETIVIHFFTSVSEAGTPTQICRLGESVCSILQNFKCRFFIEIEDGSPTTIVNDTLCDSILATATDPFTMSSTGATKGISTTGTDITSNNQNDAQTRTTIIFSGTAESSATSATAVEGGSSSDQGVTGGESTMATSLNFSVTTSASTTAENSTASITVTEASLSSDRAVTRIGSTAISPELNYTISAQETTESSTTSITVAGDSLSSDRDETGSGSRTTPFPDFTTMISVPETAESITTRITATDGSLTSDRDETGSVSATATSPCFTSTISFSETAENTTTSITANNGGLSDGAIAGIVLGALFGSLVVGIAAVLVYRHFGFWQASSYTMTGRENQQLHDNVGSGRPDEYYNSIGHRA